MPSAFKIGDGGGRVVETEARGELQAIGRERERGGIIPLRCSRTRPRAASLLAGSPPQIGRPDRNCTGRSAPVARQVGQHDRATCRRPATSSPSARCSSHRAVPKPRLARCGTISRRRIANSSRTSASRSAALGRRARLPIEHGRAKCLLRKRIGNVVAVLAIGLLEFLAAAFAHGFGQRLRENRKRTETARVEPHSSPMNSSGGIGASSVIGERRGERGASRSGSSADRPAGGCRSGRGSAGN